MIFSLLCWISQHSCWEIQHELNFECRNSFKFSKLQYLQSFTSYTSCPYTFINFMNLSMASSSPGNCFFRLAAILVFPAWMWYSLAVTEGELQGLCSFMDLIYSMLIKCHNLSYLRWSGGPRSSVSKCSSSCVNCSCPSVIWSRATFSRLFSWSCPM